MTKTLADLIYEVEPEETPFLVWLAGTEEETRLRWLDLVREWFPTIDLDAEDE